MPEAQTEPDIWSSIAARYPAIRLPHALNVSARHRIVYVTNPKAACTTMIAALCRTEANDPSIPASTIHRDKYLYLPRITELGVSQTLEQMANGAMYVFSLTRHPLTRIASAYSDKIVNHNFKDRRQAIQRLLGKPEDPDEIIGFDAFLDALQVQDPLEMDAHWRPQHINLMVDCLRYDFIGKIEQMPEALAVLSGKMPMDMDRGVREHSNAGRLDVSANPGWVRRIERIYERDFETFGY